ncbi:putative alcohol dehydrogenase [Gordonia namibiensis NBRC 108229]|uniref:Putative alcohol dehydrogenase n=1 Tax=Gordonia namibiensis NBRC 108229 TaxID=1208314 RepID=K6WNI7_9ACTN|nr:SDR family NAD(P)-dependent oxidoreductase [Gordonia namibiensis]GAC00976.1 putative alcohol dehydrogenase [Gordonia namibiensis NBRC 108229]
MSPATAHIALTFSGKGAVVTGAASGIGAAVTALLLDAGIRTLALDLREPEQVSGPRARLHVPCAVDVRDRRGVQDVIDEHAGDGLSYVVNCAGIIETTGFGGVGQDQWSRALDVNLAGAYNVIDAATTHLADSGAGAIVNISSIESHRVVALTDPDPTPQYAASKAGLSMLTRTAARALAGRGIRVNSIAPGFIATPMAAAHGDTTQLPGRLASRVPAGRFGTPDEIASAAAFLLSDQSAYTTGSELLVDGGFELT